MKNIISFSIISGLVLLRPLYSGEGLWTSIGGPPGGYSRAADFCPPPFSEVYASSDSFLYVSTDNGLTWQSTAHPKTEIYDIKIGKMGSSYCIFTATSDGIYRSINGGSWWLTNWIEPAQKLAVDRNNCEFIYAISEGRVIRTTDLGEVWIVITPQPPNSWRCVEVNQHSPNVIYAGFEEIEKLGLWKSTNAGDSWQYLGFSGHFIMDVVVSPRNPAVVFTVIYTSPISGGIYKSINAGSDWFEVKRLAQECERFQNIVISQTSLDTIFVIWDGAFMGHPQSEILYSYNEGISWETTPNFLQCYTFSYNGLKPGMFVTLLEVNKNDENFIVCNGTVNKFFSMWTVEQLWRTNDGINWETHPRQIALSDYPIEPKNIKMVGDDSIFMIGYDLRPPSSPRFYISPDKGSSYYPVFSPPPGLSVVFQDFDAFNVSTVYLIGNAALSCYLWQSEHPYTTWTIRSITPGSKYVIKIHPFNSNILFLGGANGNFWKSTDGGQSLILSNIGLPAQNNIVSSIATGFSTEGRPVTIYCGFKKTQPNGVAGLYKSTDYGMNLTFLTLLRETFQIPPANPSGPRSAKGQPI